MTMNLSDAPAYPLHTCGKERVIGYAKFTIGASGAIDASVVDDAGITGDDFASGLCNLTYPACSSVRFKCGLLSDGTVQEVVVTAQSASAGTAVVKTTTAGVATEPESGAIIMIQIMGTVDA